MGYTMVTRETKEKMFLAEERAKDLFTAVEDLGLIVAGKSELDLTAEIVRLADESFGVNQYWHKKIVRSGVNTLRTYGENPPDRIIQADDILFLDFGPIVDGWEADLGRTYVLGSDVLKLKLKQDVETAWQEAKEWYDSRSHLTGAEFFYYVTELAARYGWEFTGEIAGHIVGHWPHEQAGPGNLSLDIHPDNHADILQPDADGNERSWILELQFVDRINNIGGYFEQLLK
jgi:Xaa-Pro aminopeptidase